MYYAINSEPISLRSHQSKKDLSSDRKMNKNTINGSGNYDLKGSPASKQALGLRKASNRSLPSKLNTSGNINRSTSNGQLDISIKSERFAVPSDPISMAIQERKTSGSYLSVVPGAKSR